MAEVVQFQYLGLSDFARINQDCPTCTVGAGHWCLTSGGNQTQSHAARKTAAQPAWKKFAKQMDAEREEHRKREANEALAEEGSANQRRDRVLSTLKMGMNLFGRDEFLTRLADWMVLNEMDIDLLGDNDWAD